MKKIISISITMILCIAMIACGGSSGRRDKELVGDYIGVSGTSYGITLYGDDMSDCSLKLDNKGKAFITIADTTVDGTWVNDDDTLTITVDKTKIVGDLGNDIITFNAFLQDEIDIEMDIVFAKEGTDAANPENYMPEEDKALIGEWVGASVTDVFDEDASGEVDPDLITVSLNSDYTASIVFDGEEISAPEWSYYSESVLFEGDVVDNAGLYGEYKDGNFVITYSTYDKFYNFTMEKVGGSKSKSR